MFIDVPGTPLKFVDLFSSVGEYRISGWHVSRSIFNGSKLLSPRRYIPRRSTLSQTGPDRQAQENPGSEFVRVKMTSFSGVSIGNSEGDLVRMRSSGYRGCGNVTFWDSLAGLRIMNRARHVVPIHDPLLRRWIMG